MLWGLKPEEKNGQINILFKGEKRNNKICPVIQLPVCFSPNAKTKGSISGQKQYNKQHQCQNKKHRLATGS